jgi:hypothetical protein
MKYPTLDEVERADHLQICTWLRRLPSPGLSAVDNPQLFAATLKAEASVMSRIADRNRDFGGFTPEISKQIGWD